MPEEEVKRLLICMVNFLEANGFTTESFQDFYRQHVYPNREAINKEIWRRLK